MSKLNIFPTGYETNKPYNVSEATEILSQWGLSINEKKTRSLIAMKKLNAGHAGDNPNDRRSGYVIHGKDLYDFICSEIPIAKQLIKEHHELEKLKPKVVKPVRKNTRKVNQITIDTVDEEEMPKK